MVWSLFPVDPLPGENEYYIFKKGTYKVGRKGCDIIITKDKGVSRVHAEIIVNEMVGMDNLENIHSDNSSKVQIRDCSKYGTFIGRNLDSKEKVHEFPNKEATLKDGDVITFGTGIAQYRFSYVPLVLCASSFKPSEMNKLKTKMFTIGASVTQAWTSKCTHMVIDDFTPINDEIINSIVARKPLVRFSWIEVVAGKTFSTEIPSLLSHAPTLTLEGASLKVADSQSREQCLAGYTFMLDSKHKYKFKEKMRMLLEAGGAKVVYTETSDQCSQNTRDNLVCVVPVGMTSSCGNFKKFSYLPTVNEMELISAVVSGHLDLSVMASAPVLVTSSCSTDETVVADSDVEMETATSVRTSAAVNLISSAEDECETKMGIHETERLGSERNCEAENVVHVIESTEHDSVAKTEAGATDPGSQGFLHPKGETPKLDSPYWSSISRDRDEHMTRNDEGHPSDSENVDIIYSESLIVRESSSAQFDQSTRNGQAANFKCFRKMSVPSGNSFSNLIPFSEYPYKDSDYGNEDVAESIKEEKKRKQMEAIADDLFNNDKGRRRASGTLPSLFARR
ncbi:nijmegen breakage syndrome 1 protein-like [Salvia splendens]|uniref:nijmegen breakage syndrome 1 protein-like n=1 Tax=Salvia splendens TaxID=180675 RepID=UPI001C25D504|nr:nijmegen breakage syndrome 1 protein-like [Salvia splendens]